MSKKLFKVDMDSRPYADYKPISVGRMFYTGGLISLADAIVAYLLLNMSAIGALIYGSSITVVMMFMFVFRDRWMLDQLRMGRAKPVSQKPPEGPGVIGKISYYQAYIYISFPLYLLSISKQNYRYVSAIGIATLILSTAILISPTARKYLDRKILAK